MLTKLMKFVRLIVTGFYLGLAPKAPGTVGTLLGIPLAILAGQFGDIFYLSFVLVFIIGAIFLVEIYESNLGTDDSPAVVIDEVAGFLISLSLIPKSWVYIIIAFVIFRTLDIFKPFPICYLERKIKGGMGVVLDDVFAGLITNVFLQIIYLNNLFLIN